MPICPNCGTPVAPPAEGLCPACGAPLDTDAARQVAADRRMFAEFHAALFVHTPRVWVTPGVVAINVLVFVAMVAGGVSFLSPTLQDAIAWGANSGPRTLGGEWWRLISAVFLHFGVIHLAINMWVLWDAGRLVERLTGNVGYLLLYLFSGVMGNIVSLLWSADKVGAGASGAVFGVIGALGGFLLLRRDTVPMQMLSGLRSSLGAFVIMNVVIGYTIPFIDLAAHMGGLAAGAVCGMVMSRPIRREQTGGRTLRNLAVLALAAIAVPVGLALLPAASEDPRRQIEELAAIEELTATDDRLLDRFEDIQQKLEEGELTGAEAADLVEAEVLRPWSDFRNRLEADALPQKSRARIREYLRLREESFQHWIAALRTGDEDQHRAFLKKQQAAARATR